MHITNCRSRVTYSILQRHLIVSELWVSLGRSQAGRATEIGYGLLPE